MENFLLWNFSFDPKSYDLTFFSTWVHIQRIKSGTTEMVTEMIEDITNEKIKIKDWSLHHLVTNYITDNPESDDWRNVWMDTGEIKVRLDKSLTLNLKDTDLIRTYARDKSWDGNLLPIMPIECRIITDFRTAEEVHPAVDALGKKFKAVIESFQVIQRPGLPKRVEISIGKQTIPFFEEGARLAWRVIGLCHELGGVTSWHEKTDMDWIEN
jgi:hypothetical protein